MARLTRVSTTLYLAFGTVVIMQAALPPTISTDVTITYYAAKAVVGCVAILFGWTAILSHDRQRPLGSVLRDVFLVGTSVWLTVFLLVTLIAAAASDVNPGVAFIGPRFRLDGALIVVIIYHLAQLAAALARRGAVTRQQVVGWVVAAALGAGALIGLEAVGVTPWSLLDPTLTAGSNPVGSIGHPSTISLHFAVMFVVAVTSSLAWPGGLGTTLLRLAAVPFALVLGLHAGRAGVLAALIGLVVAAVILIRRRDHRWPIPVAATALLGLAITVLSLNVGYSADRARALTYVATEHKVDHSSRLRLITWELGVRSFLDHPWFGTGTGSFSDQAWVYATEAQERLLMQAVVSEEIAAISIYRDRLVAWFDTESEMFGFEVIEYDKAHNYFLDIAIHSGLFALVAIVAFWVRALLQAVRTVPRQPEFLIGTVTYLIAVQFWFININVDAPILLLIGALSGFAETTDCSGERTGGLKLST